MTSETVVAVAVLKKEILWNTQKVQVVILTSLSEDDSEDVRRFYDVTSSFLMNRGAVQELIAAPVFEKFQDLLKKINNNSRE
mgnify:FL=1